MKRLSLSEIVATSVGVPACKPVPTPEWGEGTGVYIAELTADERDTLETEWAQLKDTFDDETNVGFRGWVVTFCLCDENRVFDANDYQERQKAFQSIGAKGAKVISRLFNVASKLNGLVREDIENLEKKSGATTGPKDVGSGE